jgi:hypothetical protein
MPSNHIQKRIVKINQSIVGSFPGADSRMAASVHAEPAAKQSFLFQSISGGSEKLAE